MFVRVTALAHLTGAVDIEKAPRGMSNMIGGAALQLLYSEDSTCPAYKACSRLGAQSTADDSYQLANSIFEIQNSQLDGIDDRDWPVL